MEQKQHLKSQWFYFHIVEHLLSEYNMERKEKQ